MLLYTTQDEWSDLVFPSARPFVLERERVLWACLSLSKLSEEENRAVQVPFGWERRHLPVSVCSQPGNWRFPAMDSRCCYISPFFFPPSDVGFVHIRRRRGNWWRKKPLELVSTQTAVGCCFLPTRWWTYYTGSMSSPVYRIGKGQEQQVVMPRVDCPTLGFWGGRRRRHDRRRRRGASAVGPWCMWWKRDGPFSFLPVRKGIE